MDDYITLVDNLPAGICRTSPEGRFLMANPACARLFGYDSPDDLTKVSVFSLYADPEERKRLVQDVLEKGEVLRREVLMLRKDGSQVWVAVTAKAVRDNDGSFQYLEGLFEDIQKLKRAEQRITRLNACLLDLTEDPRDNVNRLVHLCGELLNAACALYNRLEGDLLCSISRWHTPDDYNPVDKAFGHICTDVIRRASEDVVVLTDLQNSEYARTDPNVVKYGLQTYMGKMVKFRERPVGSLCVAYTDDYLPDEDDKRFVSIIASAIAVEEHRAQYLSDLRENEERFRTITASANDAIIMVDTDGKICLWNDAAVSMFGYTAQEVVGQDVHSILAPKRFRETAREGMERFRVNGTGAIFGKTLDMAALRRNGEEFPVEISIARVQFRNRWHAIAIVRDVSERKRTEEEINRVKAAMDQAGDAIGISTPRGKPLYLNRAFQRLFEYDVASLRRAGGATALFADRDFARRATTAVLRGEPYEGETEIVSRSGKRIPVIFRSAVLRNDRNEVTALCAVYTDIADRKKAELQLAEHARRLETTNRELEETIQRANRMAYEAEAANRAKSAFLANMSHEIRTPLNGVIGMTELLLGTELTDEQREYAEVVRNSAEALLGIINDILDFSKIEAGKMDLEEIEFDLRSTVEDVVDVLAHRAHQKGLEMALLLHHDLPYRLMGDPGRLRQVLLNLIGNAVKFTEHGEVFIRVKNEAIYDDHAVIRFEISDTGVGISPDIVPLLFKPFTQADSSVTRKFGGTGLGLAISKQLVQLMGGDITVHSTLGKGSTFCFTVSFRISSTRETTVSASLDSLNGLRVLVVDDSATNREVFRTFLKVWGCRVTDTGDPHHALELMTSAAHEQRPFEVVLLDYMMPGMDGATFAQRVKENPLISSAHLILLTSSPQRGDAARARSVGIDAYLTKPLKQRLLRDCLLEIIHPAHAEAKQEKAKLITTHSIREKQRALKKILLVEDNPINQKVALRMLERLGYHCDCAGTGKEAVQAVLKSPYDLVLMDCQMPEMDGFAATRAIRAQEPSDRHVPIVALTALAMKGDAERCKEAGMDDYIAKPIAMAELNRILTRWLGKPDIPLPSTSVASEQSVDLARLEEVCGGDFDLERELIHTFDEDSRARLREMEALIVKGDCANLRITAHALKGASANMGAKRMSEMAANLEQMAIAGNLQQAQTVLEKLTRAQQEVQAVFMDYLASRSA